MLEKRIEKDLKTIRKSCNCKKTRLQEKFPVVLIRFGLTLPFKNNE